MNEIILEPNGCVSLNSRRIGAAWEYDDRKRMYTARIINEPCIIIASSTATLQKLVAEYIQQLINKQQ